VSIIGTLSKASAAAGAAAGAAGVGAVMPKVTPIPHDQSIWLIAVLGIPLAVLASALAGAAVRHLSEPSQPDQAIPARVLGIVADGFIGGWVAMLLIGLPSTAGYIGPTIRPEVVGAVCALLVQFGRKNGKGYFDQVFAAGMSWFTRKRDGGDA
jgi:hypothetical protein